MYYTEEMSLKGPQGLPTASIIAEILILTNISEVESSQCANIRCASMLREFKGLPQAGIIAAASQPNVISAKGAFSWKADSQRDDMESELVSSCGTRILVLEGRLSPLPGSCFTFLVAVSCKRTRF